MSVSSPSEGGAPFPTSSLGFFPCEPHPGAEEEPSSLSPAPPPPRGSEAQRAGEKGLTFPGSERGGGLGKKGQLRRAVWGAPHPPSLTWGGMGVCTGCRDHPPSLGGTLNGPTLSHVLTVP